jgi:dolichyl-phosphate-mannose--protein O-mannosyl transferase
MVVLAVIHWSLYRLRVQVSSRYDTSVMLLLMVNCMRSVKWVGLFATALVGLYTVEDLWDKFGDLKMPKVSA